MSKIQVVTDLWTGKQSLIRAKSPAAAVRYASKGRFEGRKATDDEIIKLVDAGTKILDADVEEVAKDVAPEGGVKAEDATKEVLAEIDSDPANAMVETSSGDTEHL